MLTKSPARRLISAGLPAPSQITASYSARSSASVACAVSASRGRIAR
jgi:hypothetical protein